MCESSRVFFFVCICMCVRGNMVIRAEMIGLIMRKNERGEGDIPMDE